MTISPGDRPVLPGLELVELQARTSLNEVWRGVRLDTGAPVAVKLSSTAAGPALLRQEAEIAGALRGEGVAEVVPVEYRAEPVPHLVLPWKGGRTFREALEGSRTGDAIARNAALLLKVTGTVARVHRSGFLHGDLKPENILLDDRGRPWLTDFGMARTIRAARLESRVSLSMSESAPGWGGTLVYLPPEGLQGEAPTPAWDVYALGVMLHEVLLGRRPDRAATPAELRTLLPEAVVEVLLEALAYDPKERCRSAQVLEDHLRRIGRELVATGPVRWALRSRRMAIAGLAAFFVALRYTSVAAILAGYAAVVVSSFIEPPMLMILVPAAILHLVVRWEGPETPEEAALRRSGSGARGP